jgi:hypothetical protein
MRRLPTHITDDPNYRRLRYIRYADDFLLGLAGPKSEAEAIKHAIGGFLRDSLKLELSEAKTLITHGRTGSARFLGYDIGTLHNDTRLTNRSRNLNGVIGLRVPHEVVKQKCARYMRQGKAVHLPERTNDDVFSIIAGYDLEYRGLVEYYRLAYNLRRLNTVKWIMETSLTKTLAHKLRISVANVYRRLSAIHDGRKVLKVTVRREGKKPLVAIWGSTDLVRRTRSNRLNDTPAKISYQRSELVTRLLADTCELCDSQDRIEVHHIRKLADLNKPGRRPKPEWMKVMAARRRKTLVVCQPCHAAITHGRLHQHLKRVTGEPDAVKVARPVRRGAVGKVPLPE